MNVVATHVKIVGHVQIISMAIHATALKDALVLIVKQVHSRVSHIIKKYTLVLKSDEYDIMRRSSFSSNYLQGYISANCETGTFRCHKELLKYTPVIYSDIYVRNLFL